MKTVELFSYCQTTVCLRSTEESKEEHFFSWDKILVFSALPSGYYVILSDGETAFRLNVDDWNRLLNAAQLKLGTPSGLRLYTKNEA
jgi:hypothetical protein